MAGVFWGKPLAGKDVAQVSVAVITTDLHPLSVWVGETFDCIGEVFIKRRPAAPGVELGFGRKKRRITPSADIRALFVEIIVFTSKWRLCPAADDDGRFFISKFIVWHSIFTIARGGCTLKGREEVRDMKNKVDPCVLGMVVGKFAALMHAIWAALVALGLAQPYMDWVFSLHFIQNPYTVKAFDLMNAAILVAFAFIMGYVVGWILGSVWNWKIGKK